MENTISLDEVKFLSKIEDLISLRDAHYKFSAAYIELDNQINLLMDIVRQCEVKNK